MDSWVFTEVRGLLGAEIEARGFPGGLDDLIRLTDRSIMSTLEKAIELAMEYGCDCMSADDWTVEPDPHQRWCCGIRVREKLLELMK